FLWLVNRENPLPADFRPDDLVKLQGVELREPARDAFIEMQKAMEADGVYGLRLQSAYRAHSYQRAIFEQRVKELLKKGHSHLEAEALTSRSIQYPGASEHQLGLALDVSTDGKLSQSFAETEAGLWLAKNCHNFGFIIRYQKSKTDITKIIYEPWHLRYVGVPHAKIIYDNAIALEEYPEFLQKFHMYVAWEDDGYYIVSHTYTPPPYDKDMLVSKVGYNAESYVLSQRKYANLNTTVSPRLYNNALVCP
ncbi:MAG: M15 family metallopeptidase, partial [Defluviitaleaceae bacterium]|nr:M15 family metallopeptidase [Defluviitaleaceae bacterium]